MYIHYNHVYNKKYRVVIYIYIYRVDNVVIKIMGVFSNKLSAKKRKQKREEMMAMNETATTRYGKKKTLMSQQKNKRMGVLPDVKSLVQVNNEQLKESAYSNNGLYWIISIVIFVLYFFYRKYKTRHIKRKIALKKRQTSLGHADDEDNDIELGNTMGTPTVGLEMRSINIRRILPTLRGLPTSKTGVKAVSIVHKGILENIVKDLPTRYAICDWNLVYSSQRDGYSLNTCLNFSKNRSGPSLLVIKDSFGHIFGAFASETIEKRDSYFGTGETFVAKFFPNYHVYKSTRDNQEYIVCEKGEFLAFGGGGKFALHLDKHFKNGISESSKTFDNEILSKNMNFKCVEIELWCFVHTY